MRKQLKLAAGVLVVLLQRTPVLRIAADVEELAIASPAGALLRSAVAAASVLGAAHTVTGATPLAPSSGTASGITLALHSSVLVAYTVSGTASPQLSWTVGGSIPPGLNFSGLTSPGVVNTQSELNPNGLLVLGGSPTAAGTYPLTLIAWGSPDGDGAKSDVFSYQIIITPGAGAPTFTLQPQDVIPVAGQTVTFTAAASSTTAYQWRLNGTPLSGATGATLTLTNVQAGNAGVYSVTATNANGTTESNNATLTLAVSPTFTRQPQSQTVATGSTAAFSVSASGTPTPTYQWSLEGVGIAGATSSLLVVPAATAAQTGHYACTAVNSAGTAGSDAALLAVASTPSPGRLVNLSVLSPIQSSLTMGFVIGGAGASGSENLLIRATGPALAKPPFNVPGVMIDPTLTVVKQASGVTIATNSGWGTPASNQTQVTNANSAVGAFALTDPTSLDSALVTSLPISVGGYTANVAGKSGDSGYALAEVYDDTPAYTTALPRLMNLSCLTTVAPNGTLNVGFVGGGTTAKTVLIRASGPALAAAPLQPAGHHARPDPVPAAVEQPRRRAGEQLPLGR